MGDARRRRAGAPRRRRRGHRPGPDPYTVGDRPGAAPDVLIGPGQVCTDPEGHSVAESMDLGVRTWGNAAEGETVMLCGAYEEVATTGVRVLGALPPLLVCGTRSGAARWSTSSAPRSPGDVGQEVVLDRVLDLVVVSALRSWLARPDAEAPAWYPAHADEVVGRALRLLQTNPAHPWTVAELAHEVGMSRAALARRFTDLVGEPPMTFLTSWRLARAADLLRRPDATVAAVASEVGYATPFALERGVQAGARDQPRDHRRRVTAASA